MRTVPTESDRDDVAEMNAQPWQLELLALNPSYPHWGPHEDYMIVRGDGWNAPMFFDSWADFGVQLDELNEVVNFYFSVCRASESCASCDGSGYAPDAKAISDAFYDFAGTGQRWRASITVDEAEALVEHGRLRSRIDGAWRSPEVVDQAFVDRVNAANERAGFGDLSHDAINRCILIEQRCKRLDIDLRCPECSGRGHSFTAPAAHVALVLWLLHPRKSASRGVEIKRIERADLPRVLAFLKQAADRNAERFARVVRLADATFRPEAQP